MGPIEIVASKIKSIADAIRDRTGETAPMTLDEMAEAIEYMPGDGGPMETLILVDENGYEMQAFLTEEEVELNATPNDIRIGMTAVTDAGVTVGEKEIPPYYASAGWILVPNGSPFDIPFADELYDFTRLQAIICVWGGSVANSVVAEKVVIDENLYAVTSSTVLSAVTKDDENKKIKFGITNTTGNICLIRYFTFKECY